MILLFLAHLGLACSPVDSSELRILIEDGETDLHPLAHLAIQLGDAQGRDPGLSVQVLDEDEQEVPFTVEQSFHESGSGGRIETRLLQPEEPLEPGRVYTLAVDAPDTELGDAVTFTVGEDEVRDEPPAPSATFRRHEDVRFEDGEMNSCMSEHRIIELTVDPLGFGDELTFVHVWDHLHSPEPDLDGFGDLLTLTNGNPTTLRFETGLDVERTCVTVALEDALGQRSAPTSLCYEGPLDEGDDIDAGCACDATAAPSPTLALALAPLLIGLLRRRSR